MQSKKTRHPYKDVKYLWDKMQSRGQHCLYVGHLHYRCAHTCSAHRNSAPGTISANGREIPHPKSRPAPPCRLPPPRLGRRSQTGLSPAATRAKTQSPDLGPAAPRDTAATSPPDSAASRRLELRQPSTPPATSRLAASPSPDPEGEDGATAHP